MKTILLTFLLFILALLPATAATKKPQANPINIAATLVEKTDSAKVASTLEYYGYTPQDTENGYCVMKNSNGNEIRFSFNEGGTPSKYPTVIVKHNIASKDIPDCMKGLDFESTHNGYKKEKNQFSRHITQCQHGPNGTLIFRRSHR